MATYYTLLNVAPTADEKSIHSAYRKLVLKYHPDQSSDPFAKDKFLLIQEAYVTLKDPISRNAYDKKYKVHSSNPIHTYHRGKIRPSESAPKETSRITQKKPGHYSIRDKIKTSSFGKSIYEEKQKRAAQEAIEKQIGQKQKDLKENQKRSEAQAKKKIEQDRTQTQKKHETHNQAIEDLHSNQSHQGFKRASNQPQKESFLNFKEHCSTQESSFSHQTLSSSYKRMRELLGERNYKQASIYAQKIIQEDPLNISAYEGLGDIELAQGNVRGAIQAYSYVCQLCPDHQFMKDKLEDLEFMVAAWNLPEEHSKKVAPVGSFLAAAVVLTAAFSYIATSNAPAAFSEVAFISTWTYGLIGMFFISGASIGTLLTMQSYLDPFCWDTCIYQKDQTLLKRHLLGAFQFWILLILAILYRENKKVFGEKMTRLLVSTAGVTFIFSLASILNQNLNFYQNFVWGGNIIYCGALFGWIITDGYLNKLTCK